MLEFLYDNTALSFAGSEPCTDFPSSSQRYRPLNPKTSLPRRFSFFWALWRNAQNSASCEGLGWCFCLVFGASTDDFPDLRSVQFFAKRFLLYRACRLYIGAASLHCAPPSHSYSSSTNPQNLNLDTSRSQLSCELRFRAISSAIDI